MGEHLALFRLFACALVVGLFGGGVQGQHSGGFQNPAPTPVPILREINTHNQDGSYTYGYESGDGSYKIETKSVTGEVQGKYGYYDPQGQLREIEYGATKTQGFVPQGTGIDPLLAASYHQSAAQVNEVNRGHLVRQSPAGDDDDGQYRPALHEDPYAYIEQVQEEPRGRAQQETYYQFPQQQQQQQAFPVSRQQRRFRPSRHHNRQHQQQQQYAQNEFEDQVYQYPQESQQYSQFQGHPASNFNFNSGTYSISY